LSSNLSTIVLYAPPVAARADFKRTCRRWQDWAGFSAVPQLAPSSRALQCSQELLDLGTCLPAALARRLLVLNNAVAAPLQFVWDLGVFEEERGAISGRLTIVPATGAAITDSAVPSTLDLNTGQGCALNGSMCDCMWCLICQCSGKCICT
jgi:hypothetical protein